MNGNLSKRIKRNKETAIALILSAVLAFLFLLNSPLHLWRCAPSGIDSSVFKTVALMMDKGYMPYKDTFDHKGPLLYAINYWGLKIAYYRGVWVFEAIFMTITFFMLYKIARLKINVTSSVLVVFTAISMLFGFFEQGNFTEEYAMTFISIGIYIFLDYLLNSKISWQRIALSGFSVGAVCLLRPNMIAVWIVFCTAIFFRKIAENDWRTLAQFVLWFLIGFLVIIVPFIVWLIANGAFSSCIEDYLIFNMRYSSAEGGRALFSAKWSSFFNFASKTVYVMAFCGIFYGMRKNAFTNAAYAIYMVIGIFLLCMSGMSYGHYGMVLVPVVVYPLSLVLKRIEDLPSGEVAITAKMLISIYVVSSIIVPSSIELIKAIPYYYETKDSIQFDDTTKQVSEMVADLTSEDETITVYGNWDIVYVMAHRMHATQFSYQFPIGQVMPEIMDEYMKQLEEELPSVVVVASGNYDGNIQEYLENNSYVRVWPDNDEELNYNKSTLIFYRPQE